MGIWLYLRGKGQMKNLTIKLSISMIVIIIAIILFVFALIDYYEEKYILSEFDDMLLNEASYYDNYKLFLEANRREKSASDISVILLDDTNLSVVSDSKNSFAHEYNLFRSIYQDGYLKENEILKVDDEKSSYISVLIRVDDKQIIDELKDVVNYYPASFNGDHALLVFYMDISAYSDIFRNVNIAFLILLLISILIAGIVGSYFGYKIEDSRKKIGHFFQNASHELKTPLTSIRGYAEAIKTGSVDNSDGALNVIIKQSDNMQKLIDEILTISKLDSDEYVFHKEDIDINSIIEDGVEKYQDLEDKKHIAVELSLDENHFIVVGDGLQIYKAISTIIDNAFKYADSVVKITTYVANNHLNIDIFNDGSSISKKDLQHIFDRFYSGSNISTGIGLAMAKEIVTLSGGEVKAINVNGGVLLKVIFTLS